MSFTPSQLLPGIENGLNRVGFLFGAGTSKEAGYPLTGDLTKSVVSSLSPTNINTLDEILKARGLSYDRERGEPDIEFLCDLVTECSVSTRDRKYINLEGEIQRHIVKEITSVDSPDLRHHIQFLNALKRRSQGTSSTVTIFTTNYDVLFELAASKVGVRMETGFDGLLRRKFDPVMFDLVRGSVRHTRFIAKKELHVNLIKLHGSISWLMNDSRVFESEVNIHETTRERVMILPRRQKVMDTLSEPFDQLFTRAVRILGSCCKYVVTCGFSFRDKHINDQLIFPKLRDGSIRMAAMCKEEPECFRELKQFPPFHAGFPSSCFIDGSYTGSGTDLWKFSALSNHLDS